MKEYIGNNTQLFDVRQYTFSDGKAAGTRAIDIWNGSNLHFTILPDRALDIFTVRYKNNNMSFLTPNGVVNPKYFNDTNNNWLRSFAAGFLTTCGLQSIGAPDCNDPDLTMHGRIANTPAENLSVVMGDDGMSVTVTGTMREVILFGARLFLRRSYYCEYGSDRIQFTDTITNAGFERVPLSVLYHFNIGYPLLSEHSKIYIPAYETIGRDAHAAAHIDDREKVLTPQAGFQEMCYYNKLTENCFGVDNPSIGTSMRISFETDGLLDRLVQWRMLGRGDYVMGMEPASCTLDGRTDAVANGSQKYIDAGASLVNKFSISFREL